MTLKFYKMTSDKRKCGKTKTQLTSVSNVKLKETTSLVNPTFMLANNDDVIKSNYIYCADFERYYFITDIKRALGGVLEVSCHVDVLETYKDKLSSMSAFIERQEHFNSAFIVDNELPIACGRDVHTIHVGGFGDTLNYILCVNGGSV